MEYLSEEKIESMLKIMSATFNDVKVSLPVYDFPDWNDSAETNGPPWRYWLILDE